MELNDDSVLKAIQQHAGDGTFTADDLLQGTPHELIFHATVWSAEPAEALRLVEECIQRLEAKGYVADRGTAGYAVTVAGRAHLREVEKGEPNRGGRF